MTPLPPLLFEDACVLAFAKPSGLAVQAGSGLAEDLEGLVAAAFTKRNGKAPRLAHRLDRETSGVIVFARTKPAAAFLSAAFAERRAQKTYFAVVCGGAPEPPEGEISAPLARAVRDRVEIVRVARAGDAHAQDALTAYRTVAKGAHAALLSLRPHTGRMHQLRVHLAAIGRPIAGDGKYGGLFTLAGVAIPRTMLHAARLVLPHPNGGTLDLSAPPPPDFAAVCDALHLRAAEEGATSF